MKAFDFRSLLKRDGWILAAMLLCVGLCLCLASGDGAASGEESRISRVLSAMEGAGTVDVAIRYDADSVPCGALVVADGANSIAVQLRLTDAVVTLLSLDPDSVAVYPRHSD